MIIDIYILVDHYKKIAFVVNYNQFKTFSLINDLLFLHMQIPIANDRFFC